VIAGYIYRIRVAEKFMADQLGIDYLNYKSRSKMIIPFVY
jgi:protein-S-isoprenylcysteine O-methyltransferase Ste14